MIVLLPTVAMADCLLLYVRVSDEDLVGGVRV